MPGTELGLPLGQLVTHLGDRIASWPEQAEGVLVAAAALWLPGDPAPSEPGTLVICPATRSGAAGWEELAPLLASPAVAGLVVWPPAAEPAVPESVAAAVLVVADGTDAGRLLLDAVQAVSNPLDSGSRRLTALQRSLTQALSETSPMSAVVGRLGKVCNASSAVITTDGQQVQATGPLPLALLLEEIGRVSVDTQSFDVDGWAGVAVRVNDPVVEDAQYGWIVAASRRPGFPDPYAISAVQLAASLVETSLRIDVLTRSQERAVQSALLEQALALEVRRDDRELSSRLSGIGIRFDSELRVVVVRPMRRTAAAGQEAPSTSELAARASEVLVRNGIPCLATSRERSAVLLAQCSAATASRLLLAPGTLGAPALVGVGRTIRSVGGVADSYHDAQLAVQALRSRKSSVQVMAFEDFDFATRLFADVGLERMTAWAAEFLAPLDDREALLDGLKSFLQHDQNVNVAASALNIHHNSLRYRLAKVEELLKISLRDPAAISSVFLALTALELGRPSARRSLEASGRAASPSTHDVEAPSSAAGRWLEEDRASNPGVVLAPER